MSMVPTFAPSMIASAGTRLAALLCGSAATRMPAAKAWKPLRLYAGRHRPPGG
jgi:hypothetical protein